MKKISLFFTSLFVVSIIFSGCNNDDDDPIVPAPTPCTTVLSQEREIYDDGVDDDTTHKVYIYNANKKLVKITYAFNGNPVSAYDTIKYNGSGEITTVESFLVGNPTPLATNTYTYTSGKITSVNEVSDNGNGDYDRTRTFTYTSGVVSRVAVVYNSGSRESEEIDTLKNIVVTNGNITSATLRSLGNATIDNQTVTLTYDLTAANPYSGLFFDTNDPLGFYNANNVLSVTAAGGIITILTRTYTYADGRVATSNEVDGTTSDETKKTFTYNCQ